MPETFPIHLLTPASERWRLMGVTISGGLSAAGGQPLSRTDGGGLWMCWMDGIEMWSSEQLRAARALEARMDHGVVPILVPAFEIPTRPIPAGGAWQMVCAVSSSAALRATSIEVTHTVGAPFSGGEKFSIDHPTRGRRLYIVAEVIETAGVVQTLSIRPPLREAVTDEALDLNAPSCLMRLANPDEFLGALDASHESTATAVWVEAFDAA